MFCGFLRSPRRLRQLEQKPISAFYSREVGTFLNNVYPGTTIPGNLNVFDIPTWNWIKELHYVGQSESQILIVHVSQPAPGLRLNPQLELLPMGKGPSLAKDHKGLLRGSQSRKCIFLGLRVEWIMYAWVSLHRNAAKACIECELHQRAPNFTASEEEILMDRPCSGEEWECRMSRSECDQQ